MSIYVESNNTVYDSRENCNAIIEHASNTLIRGCENTIIPKSVTSIGTSAFYGCRGLTSITIPEIVTTIGSNAFYGCSGLTSIHVNPNNKVYDSRENCNAIIERVSNTLIRGCENTIIPKSVTSIGTSAFSGCSGLTSITIPESVTTIGFSAFYGCSGLTSITIPESVTSIGSSAFYNTGWYEAQPDGLVYAGKVAYKYKGSMPSGTTIDIAEGTLGIAGLAFSGCSGLTSITIPESVTSIGSSAFYNTGWYNAQPDGLVYAGKVAYKYKGTMPYNTRIDLKEGTKGIAEYAFSGCRGLTSISIPASVTNIGSYAFNNCQSLTSITIPESVTSIGNYAFEKCSNMRSILFPKGVNSIGYNALHGSSVKLVIAFQPYNIYLPESCVFINLNDMGENEGGLSKFSQFFSTLNVDSMIYNGRMPSISFVRTTGNTPFQPKTYDISQLKKDVGTYVIPYTYSYVQESIDFVIPYSFTITPATLTVRVQDELRVYGDENPTFKSMYSGFAAGEWDSVIESHGTFATEATKTSDVGTYTVTQTGAQAKNYVFDYIEGTLTVKKAPLLMTANDKTMTYGDEVPALDVNYVGLKNDEKVPAWNIEPELFTNASPQSRVGTYPISIRSAEAKNYDVTTREGRLTVEKAKLTMKAEDTTREYGDDNPEFAVTMTGLKNNETEPEWLRRPYIGSPATRQSPVGDYPIEIHNGEAVNYDLTTTNGTLTVTKALLTATPIDVSREYGEANPTFSLQYDGLKNYEYAPEWQVAPAFSTTATTTSAVGEYEISLTGGEPRNYTLQANKGTLTVTKAPLTMRAESYTRNYGEENPSFNLVYEGLKNGETTPCWQQQPTISTEASTMSDVGSYPITVTGGAATNYEVWKVIPGVLTVTPVPLRIAVQNASRLYFDDDPELKYTCTGFVGTDNEDVLSSKPHLQALATRTSPVGTYPIEASGAVAKNYTFHYENGELTINPRSLLVSVGNYTRPYGEENPAFELQYDGFVNDETENVFLLKPKAVTQATRDSDVGNYPIDITEGMAQNYELRYVGGRLTIERAFQTLVWEQELSTMEVGEEMELTAVASSGLEITYTVTGSNVCAVKEVEGKNYLQCLGAGDAVIAAEQIGNQNYWPTQKTYKTIQILPAAVTDLNMSGQEVEAIYDASGRKLPRLQKGVNLLRMSDGTTRKVVVK